MSNTRAINIIAREIKQDWTKPYFGAVPYLDAMQSLGSIHSYYYQDSASNVIMYFLANANTWRGDKARAIKAELKAMIQ